MDHVSTGATWTYTTTPDSDGTTLTLAFSFTRKSSLLNKAIGWALASQDRQLDRMLAAYKKAFEA